MKLKEVKADRELGEYLRSKANNLQDQEEDDISYLVQITTLTEQDLMRTHSLENIADLRLEIRISISEIIEKKAMSYFTYSLQNKSKLQTPHFFKPDVDLNLYINNLKTNLEKILALKIVGNQYAGMLSKSYQEVREKTKHLFTSNRYLEVLQGTANISGAFRGYEDSGSRSRERSRSRSRGRSRSSSREHSRSSSAEDSEYEEVIIKTQKRKEIEEEPQSQEREMWQRDLLPRENKYIISDEYFNGFPSLFSTPASQKIYIDRSIYNAKEEATVKFICYFQENCVNNDKMRSRIYVVSQEFLDKLICHIFIHSEHHQLLDDPINFLSMFICLAGNPLNELRILDIFFTFATFDISNTQALAVFNQHFDTKLEAKELEKKRESFLVYVGMILEKYHKMTYAKRSGLDIENFEELAEKAYRELGVVSFKSKLPPESLIKKTITGNYLESFLKALFDRGYLGRKMDNFVRYCLNRVNKSFVLEYFAGNQQMWVKIFYLVKLMACIDLRSGIAKKLLCLMANCLQNDQIFLNFIHEVLNEADPILEMAASNLLPIVQKLTKSLPSYDDNLFDQTLHELGDNTSLWQIQIFMKLLYGQFANLAMEMQFLQEKNLIDDNLAFYTKIQYFISCILENSRLKKVFYLLANIITLFEKIRQANSKTLLRVKSSLPHIFELTLNIYFTVRMQKDMNEKIAQIEFKASVPLQMQKSLHRVASKSEDEPLRNKSAGIETAISEFETAEEIEYEDLFIELSTKAKNLLQEILPGEFEFNTESNKIIFIDFPWLISFVKKRELLYKRIANEQSSPNIQLKVRRNCILEDTIEQIENFLQQHPPNAKLSRSKLRIVFSGEPGIDAGGLTNEWLTLLSKKLFDPSNQLFKLTSNNSTISPDPQSQVIFNYYSYFQLAGFLVGYAICQRKAIPVNFSHPFLKLILNKKIAINDLRGHDEDLMRSLDWLLQNSVDGGVLEQEFSYELSLFNNRYKIALEESEECFDVITDSNKKQYVKRLIYSKLVKEIESQVQAFKSMFYRFIEPDHLQTFLPSELDKLIGGEEKISFEEMKRTAKYGRGYYVDSQQIVWFWEVVSQFDQEMLSNLWFFATGMRRVGINGFESNPLIVSKYQAALDALPISHTCYNEIELPEYQTKKDLSEKLILAISEGNIGFAFG